MYEQVLITAFSKVSPEIKECLLRCTFVSLLFPLNRFTRLTADQANLRPLYLPKSLFNPPVGLSLDGGPNKSDSVAANRSKTYASSWACIRAHSLVRSRLIFFQTPTNPPPDHLSVSLGLQTMYQSISSFACSLIVSFCLASIPESPPSSVKL